MTDPQGERQERTGSPRPAVRRVTVFCGSSPGCDPAYEAVARELGFALVRRDLGRVHGGANVGLMGALADGFLTPPGGTGTLDELFDCSPGASSAC